MARMGEIKMGLIPAKCTQCGANIEVDGVKEAAICPFCNTAFITEKAVYEYNISQNIVVKNANITLKEDLKELEERAYKEIDIFGYERASIAFYNLLEKYPEHWPFWWGKLVCRTRNFDTAMNYRDLLEKGIFSYGLNQIIKGLEVTLPKDIKEDYLNKLLNYLLSCNLLRYNYNYNAKVYMDKDGRIILDCYINDEAVKKSFELDANILCDKQEFNTFLAFAKNSYLCGNEPEIADLFSVCLNSIKSVSFSKRDLSLVEMMDETSRRAGTIITDDEFFISDGIEYDMHIPVLFNKMKEFNRIIDIYFERKDNKMKNNSFLNVFKGIFNS